jgi:hypothetical protein
MTDREFNQLRETCWQRPLDPAEDARARAYLAANPDAQREWELEIELTQLMTQAPNAPLSSNFTHQVLLALDQEARRRAPTSFVGGWWRRWRLRPLPGFAGSLAALLALTFLGYHQYQTRSQDKLAQDLVKVTHASGLNQPNIFQDFDVIQRLGQLPQPADEELWLVLSQAQAQ